MMRTDKGKQIMSRGLFLYTFPNGTPVERKVDLTFDGWVIWSESETCPIEDLGDYVISDFPLEDPFSAWLDFVEGGEK